MFIYPFEKRNVDFLMTIEKPICFCRYFFLPLKEMDNKKSDLETAV
jgi:hypothetical protein